MKSLICLVSLLLILSSGFSYAQENKEEPPLDAINQLNELGMKTGYWEERSGDISLRGRYVNGKKEGVWESYTSGNVLFKLEEFHHNLHHGITVQLDRRGKVNTVEHLVRDTLDGVMLNYSQHSQQVMKEANYKKGKLNGLFRTFYDNGKIKEESWYKDDRKNGQSRWYNQSGNMIAEYNYENGDFQGYQKTFYENDTLSALSHYYNNKLSGEYIEYYRNGKPKLSGFYKSGEKDGLWTEYDETGKAVNTQKYKNGVVR
jgi:antitoxin component YwqK of YwqJK toxin-antitoxin module